LRDWLSASKWNPMMTMTEGGNLFQSIDNALTSVSGPARLNRLRGSFSLPLPTITPRAGLLRQAHSKLFPIALRSGFLQTVPRGSASRDQLGIYDLPSARTYVRGPLHSQGSRTRDLHPISSRPPMISGSSTCRGYTRPLQSIANRCA